MSVRDVLIKSSELGYDEVAVISEMKGNPSRIEFLGAEGEINLSLEVTVGIPNSNANSKSRVRSENLKLSSEVPELDQIGNILDIPKLKEGSPLENVMVINRAEGKDKALIEFYGSNGMQTGPKIFVKDWRP
jgi:U3 small nucleolar ribonucleoprotein protein IMP4